MYYEVQLGMETTLRNQRDSSKRPQDINKSITNSPQGAVSTSVSAIISPLKY